jgi:hypothetical protein
VISASNKLNAPRHIAMNLNSLFPKGAAEVAGLPGYFWKVHCHMTDEFDHSRPFGTGSLSALARAPSVLTARIKIDT